MSIPALRSFLSNRLASLRKRGTLTRGQQDEAVSLSMDLLALRTNDARAATAVRTRWGGMSTA